MINPRKPSYKSALVVLARARPLAIGAGVLCVFASVLAAAQAKPAAALPDGVIALQYMTEQITPPRDSTMPVGWLYGFNGSIEFKSNRWWGVVTQGSAERWNVPVGRYFGGIGPQFVLCEGRFRFHTLALAGASRDRLVLGGNQISPAEYGPSLRGGGGADVRVSRHFMLRMGEAYFTESFLKRNVHTINYSQGIGIVF